MIGEALHPEGIASLIDDADLRQAATRDDLQGAAHFDGDWFVDFCEAHFWDKPKNTNEYGPVAFQPWQREKARRLLRTTPSGLLTHSTVVDSEPRRHGKSRDWSWYDLVRALCYSHQVIAIQGNSEDQGSLTVFRWITDTIRHSPCFEVSVSSPTRIIARFKPNPRSPFAHLPKVDLDVKDGAARLSNGSVIMVLPCHEAVTYGQRLSVYHNTEACKAVKEDVYHAGSSSTGDAWCGVSILDSNFGDQDNIVWRMAEQARLAQETRGESGDPQTAAFVVRYESIHDFEQRRLAPWISADWLRSRMLAMTWGEFARNHLNWPTGAGMPAFGLALVDQAARSDLLLDLPEPRWSTWTSRRAYRMLRKSFDGQGVRIGVGLDRSQGLARGDRTVLAIAGFGVDPARIGQLTPVYDQSGEQVDESPADPRIFFPLAIVFVPSGDAGAIKEAYRRAVSMYGEPRGTRFETYQSKDLADWAQREGFDNVELAAMTDGRKASMTSFLASLLATHRLLLPAAPIAAAAALREEITRYEEAQNTGRFPKFAGKPTTVTLQGPSGLERIGIKDDCVEALMWAIDAIAGIDWQDDGGMYVG